MSDPDEPSVNVAEARIQRLVRALVLAAGDELDAALLAIARPGDGTFGELEVSAAQLLSELQRAKEQSSLELQVMEAAREQVEERLATIEQQRATIRELSTPILDLWEGVLALPIVGAVDAERASDMTSRLLERVVATAAREVILDLTGVSDVDTQTADALTSLVRATTLLGARCTITGLSPGVAQRMVAMGLNLSDIRTLRSLREALSESLTRAVDSPRRANATDRKARR